MTHEELRELTGGYALGILSEPERKEFEAHVSSCSTCAEEVRSLIDVTNGLAYAVPQLDPPAALRARVLKAVEQSEPLRAIAVKPRPSAGLPVWLAVAASLAALALGLYALTLRERIAGLEARLRDANARVADAEQQIAVFRSRIDESQQIAAIMAAEDVRRIDLAGQAPARGAAGRAYWSPSRGLVFTASNLPAPSAGRQYQLWVIPPGGQPVSAGMLDLDPNGRVMMTIGEASTTIPVGTVAVSLERAGGVPSPTPGQIYLAGSL
jgi:anti-sigma-K factor RskA